MQLLFRFYKIFIKDCCCFHVACINIAPQRIYCFYEFVTCTNSTRNKQQNCDFISGEAFPLCIP